MSKLIFEKDNEGYLEHFNYDLSKNESGNYTSNDTQVLYYGYRRALLFDEAMKSASEYPERLYKANKEIEMMQKVLEFYKKESIPSNEYDLTSNGRVTSKRACEIIKKIDENKKG